MLITNFFLLLLVFIPFCFFILLVLKKKEIYNIQPVSTTGIVVFLSILSLLLGLYPIEPGTDKDNYTQEYYGFTSERENDIGWLWYNIAMRSVLGDNVVVFFIVTAFIYTFSYFVLSRKLFPSKYAGYFLVMVAGSLGFVGYGCNTIRSGLALAIIFYAVGYADKKWLRVLLLLFAILVHKSMGIPIAAYIASRYLVTKRLTELLWMLCLLIAIFNIDITTLFLRFGFLDERVTSYIDSNTDYKVGFRLDFLIYSMLPIYIARLWQKLYGYSNEKYVLLYKTYLMTNSLWLLSMNIEYNDRIAYLSWFMIPIIVLYPILTNGVRIRNPQIALTFVMGIFIGVNVILNLR